ncbi:unnamed protein product, partial [Prorocentrum cordatum]
SHLGPSGPAQEIPQLAPGPAAGHVRGGARPPRSPRAPSRQPRRGFGGSGRWRRGCRRGGHSSRHADVAPGPSLCVRADRQCLHPGSPDDCSPKGPDRSHDGQPGDLPVGAARRLASCTTAGSPGGMARRGSPAHDSCRSAAGRAGAATAGASGEHGGAHGARSVCWSLRRSLRWSLRCDDCRQRGCAHARCGGDRRGGLRRREAGPGCHDPATAAAIPGRLRWRCSPAAGSGHRPGAAPGPPAPARGFLRARDAAALRQRRVHRSGARARAGSVRRRRAPPRGGGARGAGFAAPVPNFRACTSGGCGKRGCGPRGPAAPVHAVLVLSQGAAGGGGEGRGARRARGAAEGEGGAEAEGRVPVLKERGLTSTL